MAWRKSVGWILFHIHRLNWSLNCSENHTGGVQWVSIAQNLVSLTYILLFHQYWSHTIPVARHCRLNGGNLFRINYTLEYDMEILIHFSESYIQNISKSKKDIWFKIKTDNETTRKMWLGAHVYEVSYIWWTFSVICPVVTTPPVLNGYQQHQKTSPSPPSFHEKEFQPAVALISMLRNDRDCKYIFILLELNSSHGDFLTVRTNLYWNPPYLPST